MLISICQSLATISRRSNSALTASTVASSISISATPAMDCCLNFIFSIAQTGTITVTGTLNSVAQSEEISVTANTIASGVKLFSTVTSVAFDAGMVTAGGTVIVKWTGRDGGSVSSSVANIATDYPIRISRNSASFPVPMSGSSEKEKPKALIPYSEVFTPQDGDLITLQSTSDQFLIAGVPYVELVGFNSHWIATLERFEN